MKINQYGITVETVKTDDTCVAIAHPAHGRFETFPVETEEQALRILWAHLNTALWLVNVALAKAAK